MLLKELVRVPSRLLFLVPGLLLSESVRLLLLAVDLDAAILV